MSNFQIFSLKHKKAFFVNIYMCFLFFVWDFVVGIVARKVIWANYSQLSVVNVYSINKIDRNNRN